MSGAHARGNADALEGHCTQADIETTLEVLAVMSERSTDGRLRDAIAYVRNDLWDALAEAGGESMTTPSTCTIGAYRKRPVVISAAEWDGSAEGATEIIGWVLDGGGTARYHDPGEPGGSKIAIDTLEGTVTASPGDFVIRGVQGEHYPCKPDIFWATYEPVIEAGEHA